MNATAEIWKQNIEAKVAILKKVLAEYVTNRDSGTADQILSELKGLASLFGNDQLIPESLRQLRNHFDRHRSSPSTPDFFMPLVRSYQNLSTNGLIAEDQELPSFDEIFETYKSSGELQSLVDEFIATIQRILDEGDDHLSAHIARELEAILAQLKKREKSSLYELQAWIDLAVRTLLVVAETYVGHPGFVLGYEAIRLGYKIRDNVLQKYGEARRTLVERSKLTFVQKAVEKYPELPPKDQILKLLEPPQNLDDRPPYEGEG